MSAIRTTILDNLQSLSDDVLDEITADGHTFASTCWYRLLDSLDLSSIVGGMVRLKYALVTCRDVPVCVTPILHASGPGVYFAYSLRRYYFEHWIEEAQRLHPEKRATYARLLTGVSAYRRMLEWTGTPLDECLLVCGPLSYRGEIPVAPSAAVPRHKIYASLTKHLQTYASRQRLPLCFFAVQGESNRLAPVLEAAGCAKSFLFYDNRLNIESFDDFDGYLQSFRRTTRRAFSRDISRTSQAGIEFRFIQDFSSYSGELTKLYTQTYSKYGNSFFRHDDDFWHQLSHHLGDNAELIVAERDGQMLGFSVLLHNRRRGELWTYRIGRSFDSETSQIPYYFGLSFYGPIQRAIEQNYRRVWFGPASYEAKSVRGAEQIPLYHYFWFPRRWDRWFLQPYLQLFGKITKDEIVRSMQRPVRTQQPTPTARNRQEQ